MGLCLVIVIANIVFDYLNVIFLKIHEYNLTEVFL